MSELVSEEYRNALEHEHANTKWGVAGQHYCDHIAELYRLMRCESLLDYGSGQGRTVRKLVTEFGIPQESIVEYEPGIPEKSSVPSSPADLVICTDVLEHVEPELIDDVLSHLLGLIGKVGFITIGLTKANRVLSDGRNAHLIVEKPKWWREKIEQHVEIVSAKKHPSRLNPHTYELVVRPHV